MRKQLFGAVFAGVLCGAAASWGAPITGEVSINGSDNYTATQINFTNPANIGGDSGSFLVLGTCNGCVTMASTLVATSTETLFSGANLGHTVSLMIQAPNTFNFLPDAANPALDALDVSGAGTLTLDGQSVAGAYTLTTQGPLSNPPTIVDVTFSATAVPSQVAEPGSLFLLGTGLLGFAVGYRRWRNRRPAAPRSGGGYAVAA